MDNKIFLLALITLVVISCGNTNQPQKKLEVAQDAVETSFYEFGSDSVSFRYPDNYTLEHENDTIAIFKQECHDSVAYCANFNVQIVRYLNEYEVAELVELSKESIELGFGKENSRIINEDLVSLDSAYNGYILDYLALFDGVHLGGAIFAIKLRECVAIFSFTAPNYKYPGQYVEYRKVFLGVIQSFRYG